MSCFFERCAPFLINTPLQRGVLRPNEKGNRFNGFSRVIETVETVSEVPATRYTPLKWGVNERLRNSQALCDPPRFFAASALNLNIFGWILVFGSWSFRNV
jgi:hypothetical protein